MTFRLGSICRLSFLAAIVLAVVAVHIGRGATRPGPGRFSRQAAHPRYHSFSGYLFPNDSPRQARVLDTETGAVTLVHTKADEIFAAATCSPWQDAEGRYHLAGRLSALQEGQTGGSAGEFGIARCSFPDGRFLDRITFNLIVASPPCWFPDGSDRILFAACDGRLYDLSFPAEAGPENSLVAIEPRQIRWRTSSHRRGPTHIQDPSWPVGEAFGGRLLAAVRFRGGDPHMGGWLQLWWLKLSAEGTTVAAAGRLIARPADDSNARAYDERFPTVGMTRDGTPMLAYVVFPSGHTPGELWTAPIAFESGEAGPIPRVHARDARLLTRNCVGAAPVFSADGRFLYAAVRDQAENEVHIRRFAVDSADSLAAVTP